MNEAAVSWSWVALLLLFIIVVRKFLEDCTEDVEWMVEIAAKSDAIRCKQLLERARESHKNGRVMVIITTILMAFWYSRNIWLSRQTEWTVGILPNALVLVGLVGFWMTQYKTLFTKRKDLQ